MNDSKDLNVDELLTMLEEMQDQNDYLQELLKTEKEKSSEAQETISNLSSENSLLRNTLQQKSETIVLLNERIGTLQESDKALEENLSLRKKNTELQEEIENTRTKSEAEVLAAKRDVEKIIDELLDKEENVNQREQAVSKREKELNNEIEILAESKISNRAKKMQKQYEATGRKLSDKYRAMTASYQTMLLAVVLYGIIATVITAMQSKVITEDFDIAIGTVRDAVILFGKAIVNIATAIAGMGDKISQPIVAVIVHWFLLITMAVLLAGGCGVLAMVLMLKYIGYFKEKQKDEISLVAILIMLAVSVFAGDEIKAICSVNLFLLIVLQFALYSFIRGIIQMKSTIHV